MKEKMIFGLAFLFIVALTGAPALHAEEEFEEVYSQDDNGGSDPSAFEGDTDSMPGERAPENLPMDDAPVGAGMGIE
ncbi:MAG: hypothetical protein ABH891_03280 [Candidatus Omnitrophota bacterium]